MVLVFGFVAIPPGPVPTRMVAVTVLVRPLITDTVSEPVLVTLIAGMTCAQARALGRTESAEPYVNPGDPAIGLT